jgi:DNA-binding beta-propeller fold protein YncE
MKRAVSVSVLVTGALLTSSARAEAPAEPPAFQLEKSIALPGIKGGFDHLAIEPSTRRLFVAAKSHGALLVIDLAKGAVTKIIPGLKAPQGVKVIPQLGQVATCTSGDARCLFFDLKTLELAREMQLDTTTDNLRYDAGSQRLYVGHGKSHLAVTDPVKGTKVADVALESPACAFEIEKSSQQIFVNMPKVGKVAVVDQKSGSVRASWTLEGRSDNHALALDERNHRLFVASREGVLLVLDSKTGKVVASVPTPKGADDMQYDERRKRIFLSEGEGFVTLIEQRGPDQYRLLGSTATAKGAKTSTYSPELQLFALAVPEQDGKPAELRLYKTR